MQNIDKTFVIIKKTVMNNFHTHVERTHIVHMNKYYKTFLTDNETVVSIDRGYLVK